MHVVLGSSRQDAEIEDHFILQGSFMRPVVVATSTSYCTHDIRMLLETKERHSHFLPSPPVVFPNRSKTSENPTSTRSPRARTACTFSFNEPLNGPGAVLSHFRLTLDEVLSAGSRW